MRYRIIYDFVNHGDIFAPTYEEAKEKASWFLGAGWDHVEIYDNLGDESDEPIWIGGGN